MRRIFLCDFGSRARSPSSQTLCFSFLRAERFEVAEMKTMLRAVGFVLLLGGCGAQLSTARQGPPRPARSDACSLEVAHVGLSEMQPGAAFGPGGKYEVIGYIRVANAPEGTDPLGPEMRERVRPEACRLGGDIVAVSTSMSYATVGFGSAKDMVVYQVWAKRSATAEAPRRF
jgi:hypothetical protein